MPAVAYFAGLGVAVAVLRVGGDGLDGEEDVGGLVPCPALVGVGFGVDHEQIGLRGLPRPENAGHLTAHPKVLGDGAAQAVDQQIHCRPPNVPS
ncbi:hypothetical protein [Streptomyces sp. NPDC058695]|uniref:hypothetical protein n=1 Tax=Streptomyces sp. NPDC058695 TaxID=3346604 RepID=UPI0036545122